jgi:hypothetical protein
MTTSRKRSKGARRMMIAMNAFHRLRRLWSPVVLCPLAYGILLFPGAIRAEEQTAASIQSKIEALAPGEILTYDIT